MRSATSSPTARGRAVLQAGRGVPAHLYLERARRRPGAPEQPDAPHGLRAAHGRRAHRPGARAPEARA